MAGSRNIRNRRTFKPRKINFPEAEEEKDRNASDVETPEVPPSPSIKTLSFNEEKQLLRGALEAATGKDPPTHLMKTINLKDWKELEEFESMKQAATATLHSGKRTSNQLLRQHVDKLYDDKHFRLAEGNGIKYSEEFVKAVENAPVTEQNSFDTNDGETMVQTLLTQVNELRDLYVESNKNGDGLTSATAAKLTQPFKLTDSPFQRFVKGMTTPSPSKQKESPDIDERKPSPKPAPTLKNPPTYAAAAATPPKTSPPTTTVAPQPTATLQPLNPSPISLLNPFSNSRLRSPPKSIRTSVEQNLISPNERQPVPQPQQIDDPRWQILDSIQAKQREYESTTENLKTQLQQQEQRILLQDQQIVEQNQLIATLKTTIETQTAILDQLPEQIKGLRKELEQEELDDLKEKVDVIIAEGAEEVARMSDMMSTYKAEIIAEVEEKDDELRATLEEVQDFTTRGQATFDEALADLRALSAVKTVEQAQAVLNLLKPQLDALLQSTARQTIESININVIEEIGRNQLNVFASAMESRRRDVDNRLSIAINTEIKRGKGEIGSLVTQGKAALNATYDELNDVAISNLDAAPALYQEVADELIQTFRQTLQDKLRDTYDDYAARTSISFEHRLNSEMDQREKSFKTRLQTKVDDTLADPILLAQVTSLADARLAEVNTTLGEMRTLVQEATTKMERIVTESTTDLETATARNLVDISKAVATGKQELKDVSSATQDKITEASDQVDAMRASVVAAKAEVNELLQQVEDARRKAVQQKKKNKKSRDKYKQKKKAFNFGTSPTNGGGGNPDDSSDPDDSGDDGGSGGSNGGNDNGSANPPPRRNPHPMAAALKKEYETRVKNFNAKFHTQITTTNIKNGREAETFYKALWEYTISNSLPMIELKALTVEHPTSISDADITELERIDPSLVNIISSAIYGRLVALFNHADEEVKEILHMNHEYSNGYRAMYDLIQTFSDLLDPYTKFQWGPRWPDHVTIRNYASNLIRVADRDGRIHTEEDMMLELLLQARKVERFVPITNAFLANIELHGMDCLRNTTFFRLIKLMSDAGGDTRMFAMEDPNYDPTTHKLAINKIDNTAKPARRWAKHSVQCTMCHQYGHSPEKDHICYTSAQIFHVLKYMHHLDLEKIPKESRTILETNAQKYHNYNIPNAVKKLLISHSIDIDELDEEEYVRAACDVDPTHPSDFQ